MLARLIEYAHQKWPVWFPTRRPDRLIPAVLAGGPGHRRRGIVFIFREGAPQPSVVAKIAFSSQEGKFLFREYESLEGVRTGVSKSLQLRIPKPLGIDEIEGHTVLTTMAMPGSRQLVPRLVSGGSQISRRLVRRFLRRAFRMSATLAQETASCETVSSEELADIVDRFRSRFAPGNRGEDELVEFSRRVRISGITYKPAWQHGDVMMSNVICHRGMLAFLDWEHGRPESQPWFDIAYAPVALALMASWQEGLPLPKVMNRVLASGSWTGKILRQEMSRAWRYPLPLSWGVALTAMETSLRQFDDGREGYQEWSTFVSVLMDGTETREDLDWLSNLN